LVVPFWYRVTRVVLDKGPLNGIVVVVVVVLFVCKATLILEIKIYELKYNISLNDVHTWQ